LITTRSRRDAPNAALAQMVNLMVAAETLAEVVMEQLYESSCTHSWYSHLGADVWWPTEILSRVPWIIRGTQ
jgi:hypothetical protein